MYGLDVPYVETPWIPVFAFDERPLRPETMGAVLSLLVV